MVIVVEVLRVFAGIKETKNIIKTEDGASVDGRVLDSQSLVSMNFWCYSADFMDVLKKGFLEFLENMSEPMKDEYLLSTIADGMLKDGVQFSVLPTDDKWFGVTYKEDKPAVVESFRKLIESGIYKEDLYGDLRWLIIEVKRIVALRLFCINDIY